MQVFPLFNVNKIIRVHTRPGNPGKPGNVLEFCLVLEKLLAFFKNEDLPWKSPEKSKFASIFFVLHNYMIGDSVMRQQNFLAC